MIFDHLKGPGEGRSAVDQLTDRELEVLQLIGSGHDVRAIADQLHLSSKTVEAHRAHIKEKLNLTTAREVARSRKPGWSENRRARSFLATGALGPSIFAALTLGEF